MHKISIHIFTCYRVSSKVSPGACILIFVLKISVEPLLNLTQPLKNPPIRASNRGWLIFGETRCLNIPVHDAEPSTKLNQPRDNRINSSDPQKKPADQQNTKPVSETPVYLHSIIVFIITAKPSERAGHSQKYSPRHTISLNQSRDRLQKRWRRSLNNNLSQFHLRAPMDLYLYIRTAPLHQPKSDDLSQ